MGLKEILFGKVKTDVPTELSGFYAGALARWRDIYGGGGNWRYTSKGGLNGGTRRVAALGAAKAVCSELARLCFAEGSQIISADKNTEKYLRRVLAENNFAERFPDFLEKMFALGGGMIKVRYDGSDGGVKLDLLGAEDFVPTKWNSGGITGAAFGSQIRDGGRTYFLAETQELTDGGVLTKNRLYREGGAEIPLDTLFPDIRAESVMEGLTKPLFVYMGVNTGAFAACKPLGASVFAGAEDTVKSIDIVFDSLQREFILGKKRIIVPSYAVRGEYDENGELVRRFNANDEVFEAFSTSDSEELKISDNSALLRVNEHIEALDELLDLFCMQVGLSEGALSYKSGSVRTATEVISRNSRTYRTAGVYRKMISRCIARAAENICLLGKMAGELPESASEHAELKFADGICEDEGSKAQRAKELYSSGIISRARALSEIYGISLDEARAIEKEDFFNGRNESTRA